MYEHGGEGFCRVIIAWLCCTYSTRSRLSSLSWRKLSKRFTPKLKQVKMETLIVLLVNDITLFILCVVYIETFADFQM